MQLPGNFTFFLITPPDTAQEAERYGHCLAHMAYRVGGGPHLFCFQRPFTRRGGLMVLEHRGFDGKGTPSELCREILQECAARSFSGLFCDFEGPVIPVLRQAVDDLAPLLHRRGWSMFLPESYAGPHTEHACIVVPTALSSGSLRERLKEAVETYGAERVALGLERTAQDFTLPAVQGEGRPLERDELRRMLTGRSCAVYFSDELCAHYFTYMRPGGSAHFILYDDASSMVKKLRVAASLGIHRAFIPYGQMGDLLPELMR